jgi:hypothetical protein
MFKQELKLHVLASATKNTASAPKTASGIFKKTPESLTSPWK